MKQLRLLLMVLISLFTLAPVTAQDAAPILVYISWDGSPGWVIQRLVEEGKLPNVQRLIDQGVWVQQMQGNWPSLTAPSHAAVFNGSYGNVNGVTGNGVPAAPFASVPIGTRGPSGFSAVNLLTEPIWITAARQGRSSSLVSVTQSSPFEMYASDDYVSPQGAPAFGDFSNLLMLADPYGASLGEPTSYIGGNEAQDGMILLTDGPGDGWTNLPENGAFRSFELNAETDAALHGLLVATDGSAFDHLALSADGDYSTATILRATPPANDASQMGDPVEVTVCEDEECQTGWTYFRLAELADDGSAFQLWQTYTSNMTGFVEDDSQAQRMLEDGGAFTGNGAFLPSPFPDAPDLPNVYGEIAFQVNEWFFDNLVAEIERNEHDLYFSYSPYPDEWHHSYYSYMDEGSPYYTQANAAKAWQYDEAMYANLDAHLGRVIDALEGTGRPWNIVLFTDHGFESAWRYVYPNRILREAGLLTLDADGNVDPAQTLAYYGGENAGGVHINTVDGQAGGIVTEDDYEDVVARVTEALTSAVDPETGLPVITDVYRSEEHTQEGIGGLHGADLYLGLAPSYYWQAQSDEGAVAVLAPPFVSGIHGPRPLDSGDLLAFAVLGGTNFVDGVVVPMARSTDLTPTAALAVGLEPAEHWTGEAHEDWIEPAP